MFQTDGEYSAAAVDNERTDVFFEHQIMQTYSSSDSKQKYEHEHKKKCLLESGDS